VSEGSIVRCITRLDETCREVKSAARVIGDSSLFNKMEKAQQLIKRDIVFAKSLVRDKKFHFYLLFYDTKNFLFISVVSLTSF
jgi:hypothetical protein